MSKTFVIVVHDNGVSEATVYDNDCYKDILDKMKLCNSSFDHSYLSLNHLVAILGSAVKMPETEDEFNKIYDEFVRRIENIGNQEK